MATKGTIADWIPVNPPGDEDCYQGTKRLCEVPLTVPMDREQWAEMLEQCRRLIRDDPGWQ